MWEAKVRQREKQRLRKNTEGPCHTWFALPPSRRDSPPPFGLLGFAPTFCVEAFPIKASDHPFPIVSQPAIGFETADDALLRHAGKRSQMAQAVTGVFPRRRFWIVSELVKLTGQICLNLRFQRKRFKNQTVWPVNFALTGPICARAV